MVAPYASLIVTDDETADQVIEPTALTPRTRKTYEAFMARSDSVFDVVRP